MQLFQRALPRKNAAILGRPYALELKIPQPPSPSAVPVPIAGITIRFFRFSNPILLGEKSEDNFFTTNTFLLFSFNVCGFSIPLLGSPDILVKKLSESVDIVQRLKGLNGFDQLIASPTIQNSAEIISTLFYYLYIIQKMRVLTDGLSRRAIF